MRVKELRKYPPVSKVVYDSNAGRCRPIINAKIDCRVQVTRYAVWSDRKEGHRRGSSCERTENARKFQPHHGLRHPGMSR